MKTVTPLKEASRAFQFLLQRIAADASLGFWVSEDMAQVLINQMGPGDFRIEEEIEDNSSAITLTVQNQTCLRVEWGAYGFSPVQVAKHRLGEQILAGMIGHVARAARLGFQNVSALSNESYRTRAIWSEPLCPKLSVGGDEKTKLSLSGIQLSGGSLRYQMRSSTFYWVNKGAIHQVRTFVSEDFHTKMVTAQLEEGQVLSVDSRELVKLSCLAKDLPRGARPMDDIARFIEQGERWTMVSFRHTCGFGESGAVVTVRQLRPKVSIQAQCLELFCKNGLVAHQRFCELSEDGSSPVPGDILNNAELLELVGCTRIAELGPQAQLIN